MSFFWHSFQSNGYAVFFRDNLVIKTYFFFFGRLIFIYHLRIHTQKKWYWQLWDKNVESPSGRIIQFYLNQSWPMDRVGIIYLFICTQNQVGDNFIISHSGWVLTLMGWKKMSKDKKWHKMLMRFSIKWFPKSFGFRQYKLAKMHY